MINNKEESNPKILKNQYIPTAEFYSQVIDSLQDYSIFTLDNDLIINSWNSGATKIFQYETDEIIGKHFEIIFTEEDRKSGIPYEETIKALTEGRATDNRWHICKDDSKFFAYGLVFPLTGIDGEVLGFVKILRDLTERKKSEDSVKNYIKELEDINTHKETVLAILSHDLRSPLAGIIQGAEYLKKNIDTLASSDAKHMLDLIHKSTKDELAMLDYLVEWARIKYASDTFIPSQINLLLNVKKVFNTLNNTAATSTINLINEIEEDISVYADEKMLLSILQNIFSNGIKHTPSGGKITIKAERKDANIVIGITDTGIGMPKEMLEKLFTPQMNTLSKSRNENKGAGIGLLLAKGFVEKNSGEIWAESEEGNGSSFYFTLPSEKPLKMEENLNVMFFESE